MTVTIDTVGKEQSLEADYSRFLSIISHDLRAPLRHVREFSKLLLGSIESPDEDQLIYQGFIEGGVNKLDLMIESIVQLSRLTLCDGEPQEIEITPMLSSIIAELSAAHPDKKLELSIQAELANIQGRPDQIRELFRQVLENSFVHGSSENSIKISIEQQSSQQNLVFKIADRGKGLEERYCEKVFEIFYKLNPSERPEAAGSGLTIAREIAKLHRGSVDIGPEEDIGTSVLVRLPKSFD